jgi:hypothetical protein
MTHKTVPHYWGRSRKREDPGKDKSEQSKFSVDFDGSKGWLDKYQHSYTWRR